MGGVMYRKNHLRKRLMSIEAHSLCENLLPEIIRKKRICNQERYLKAGNMIITNLLVFGGVRIGRGHINFPRVASRYGLKYYTHTYVNKMIDELVYLGYVEQRLGFGNMLNRGMKTLLLPKNKLINNFKTVTICGVPLKEEIELRDKKLPSKKRARLIDYTDSTFTKKIRDEVKFINEALNSVTISLVRADKNFGKNFPISIFTSLDEAKTRSLTPIPFLNRSATSINQSSPLEPGQSLPNAEIRHLFNGFRRIFTGGDFSLGGRYYDIGCYSYQSIPKGIRANILIDGEPTVELDFSNMFLMMLYHQEGINFQADGYEIDGYQRDDVKKAVNIIFNTKNKRSAICTLRYHGISDGKKLIDLIKKKHSRLKKYFYTGVANELMRKESDVATEILTIAILEGIISLPVHDSFIIQGRSQSIFESIMREVYRKKFKFNPRIKLN